MSDSKPQIFLSYSHSDLETVRRLYEELKARELNIWFDKEHIGIGKWKPKTTKAIMQSRYFIFCISEVALSRINADPPSFQDEELTYALEIALNQDVNKFSIIPVRLDDCDHGDHRISVYNQFDLFKDWENDLDRLAFQMGGKSRSGESGSDQQSDFEKKIDDRLNRAEALYYAKEYKKGVALLQAIIEFEEPPSVRSHFLLGSMFWRLNKYKKALKATNSALEIDPKDVNAWNAKGVVLKALGRDEKALKAYESALEIDPKNAIVRYNKGLSLGRLSRYAEALEAFESTLEINPKNADAWYNKGNALSGLGHEEALKAYEVALEIDPKNANAWYNKGISLGRLGRYAESLEASESTLEIDPKNANAWHNKGTALGALGRDEEALKAYESALEIDPKYVNAWDGKGYALGKLGRYEESLEAYESALEIGPKYVNVWHNKGITLRKLGRKKEAQVAFAEAKRLKEAQNESKS